MLYPTKYTKNYAGIMSAGLFCIIEIHEFQPLSDKLPVENCYDYPISIVESFT